MPGTWPSHEKPSHTKYQIVMILSLLCKRPWLEGISPAFALICQYLSSTVRDLRLPFSLHGGGRSWGCIICMGETICGNNYLDREG